MSDEPFARVEFIHNSGTAILWVDEILIKIVADKASHADLQETCRLLNLVHAKALAKAREEGARGMRDRAAQLVFNHPGLGRDCLEALEEASKKITELPLLAEEKK